MTVTPRRPVLPAVLAALTDDRCGWSDHVTLWPDGVHPGGFTTQYGGSKKVTPWAVANAAEAWEVLAARDLIPPDWIADRARGFRFACIGSCDSRDDTVHEYGLADRVIRIEPDSGPVVFGADGVVACGSLAEAHAAQARGWIDRPSPPTIATCATIASDVAGLATAEMLVRELLTRLAPLAPLATTCVVWRVESVRAWEQRHAPRGLRPGSDWVATQINAIAPSVIRGVRTAADWGLAWRDAHTILHQLHELGYAVDHLAATNVLMHCPEIGPAPEIP